MPASTRTMLARTLGVVFMVNFLLCWLFVVFISSSFNDFALDLGSASSYMVSTAFLGLSSQRSLMARVCQLERDPPKPTPWGDQALPVPPAAESACCRRAGRYQRPP